MTGVSLWSDTLGYTPRRRDPLATDRADVAIVGGGYTGLWAAYYLALLDPGLEIVVIEREHVGFGASGRNGGWCVGELASGLDRLASAGGAEAALALVKEMFATVDEVGRVCAQERIECDWAKGGTIRLARNMAQLTRIRAEVEHHHAAGLGEADLRLLSAEEARRHLDASDVCGGMFFAHTAALHPAKLVHGLADAVERRGVTIAEGTAATRIAAGVVETDRGALHAPVVVRATEGYTAGLDGEKRTLAPLFSLMVATEPLPSETWGQLGLAERQTFADDRYLVIYGQRTADGRIAFGGRGAPYLFGSRIDQTTEQRSRIHDRIVATLVELLPALEGVAITHRWGGVLGVPRDWFPSVGFDRNTGSAWGGGYVGEGVAASNLAGRTLADLITNTESPRVDLPWVGHRSRNWEPEPLRWLAINGALKVMERADRAESRSGRDSTMARWMRKLMR